MSTTTLKIQSMTCQHCVHSVTVNLQEIPGVNDVKVDLNPGGVSTATVTSGTEINHGSAVAAIDKSGYSLAE